jgi:aryl-alcohol dehydrogenase-like predicted oxidoreductase
VGVRAVCQRRRSPRFQEGNLERNRQWVRAIEELARAKHCTAAQLALAWLLAQGRDIIPIPGTKRRQYLEENLRSLELVLSAADLKRLDEVARPGVVAGERYPAQAMQAVNR